MKSNIIKLLLLLSILGSSSLFGDDKKIKEKRLKIMHTYTGSLHTVQDGFLYNDHKKVIEGATMILKTAKHVKTHNMKAHLPKNQAYTYKFALKMTDRIIAHSESMLDAISRKKPLEAMDEFNYVIKQCTSCHIRVRDW